MWHFIVLPGAAMALLIALSRVVDRAIPGPLLEPWQVGRTVVISAAMAMVISWVAIRYRRQYEEELERRNSDLEQAGEFLAGIIDGSGDAIVTVDAAGVITSWNPAAEAIYGWKSTEVLGRDVDAIRSVGDEASDDRRRLEGAMDAGRTVREHDTVHRRKDGTSIRVRLTQAPLRDRDGNRVGSTSIIRDVTRLEEMETKLVERERLAALGELAAQMAHEIRNPLAGIRGACDMALRDYGADDRKREIVAEVREQIDRLNRTVEDLLQFAQPRPMRPRPTDLNELIRRVTSRVLEESGTGPATIELQLDQDVPELSLDPAQVEQVLRNLLQNAVHVTEAAGTLSIATKRTGAPGVRLVIRDSGPGIPPGDLERVFKPFYTTRTRGTGLGLTIVRNIVSAHGGTVRAANAAGGGAEFTIDLPAGD